MPAVERHPASYRDPDSRVFVSGDRILRAFTAAGEARLRAVQRTGLLERLASEGKVVETREPADVRGEPALAGYAGVVEHPALAFISHPFEWPFALLRRAALLHLDVHLAALEHGVTLSDASAYNVQFRGTQPVFIDVGSFRPYVEGELWAAHRQFCEQFLNPLLLEAELGITFNAWLRGAPEGIPTAALAAALPWRRRFSPRHLFHVLLPARAERMVARREQKSLEQIRSARLPREAYVAMLRQLRRWIESLAPRGASATTWADYSESRTYTSAEIADKRRIVADFGAWCGPVTLWDLGCNDGEFGEAAIAAGVRRVIGFDADPGALQRACARADRGGLDFLPLFQDAANPSPGTGWRGRERASFFARPRPEAVMALAFEHHLALGRNVPLDEVVDFIASLAPKGLVEFVPKTDPTVQRMLALKGDIFPDYGEEAFESSLRARARIVRRETVSSTGRRLYFIER